MTRPDDVTVIIAAKDEEATIAGVVRGCRRYAHTVLVIVDRRTTDETAMRAGEAGARVFLDEGLGKGHAMRLGAAQVGTAIIVFIDADGSHDHRDIPSLLEPIVNGSADHVSGSRLRGGSSELHGGFDEFFRLAGSSLITACINHRFGVRLSDSQNGFRAIRTDVLRALELRSNSTTIEQEMIVRSLGMGYRVAEVPSHEYQRVAGTSHISLRRVAVRYVLNLVRCLYLTRYPRLRAGATAPSLDVREPARH
jgi:glycosyltransferase involved in cell wall biosynthesis